MAELARFGSRCAHYTPRWTATTPESPKWGDRDGVCVESMNRANDEARGKNVVDPLNAALVVLKKEGHRFLQGQSDAHKVSRFSNCLLTPKGIAIMEEIFVKCDPSMYRMQMTNLPDSHRFVISKKSMTMRECIVILPKMQHALGPWFKVFWILYLWLP